MNLLVEGEFASGASAGRGFQSPEFVRHGSRSNVFENVNESEITLGVIANSLVDPAVFLNTTGTSHPFRRILVMGAVESRTFQIATPRGIIPAEL